MTEGVQGPHCTLRRENRGKDPGEKTKKCPVKENTNSLILKIKDIAIFAMKFPNLFLRSVCQVIFAYETSSNHWNWHRENLQSDGKHMEFEKYNLCGDPAFCLQQCRRSERNDLILYERNRQKERVKASLTLKLTLKG